MEYNLLDKFINWSRILNKSGDSSSLVLLRHVLYGMTKKIVFY